MNTAHPMLPRHKRLASAHYSTVLGWIFGSKTLIQVFELARYD